MQYKVYKDLIGFLLGPVRQHPGMYLGEDKISKLQNFIFGYEMGVRLNCKEGIQDNYFGENGFINWFYKKNNTKMDSSWESPFLKQAEGDERKALLIYFKYLEEFNNTLEQE